MRGSTGAAAEFAEREFGGILQENEDNPQIGVAAENIFGNDPERVLVTIINLSANTMYIGLTEQVSSTNGILLAANGGSLTLNAKDDYVLTTRALYGIAAGANSQLYHLSMKRIKKTGAENPVDAT